MVSNMIDGLVNQGIKLSFRDVSQLRRRFFDPFVQAAYQFQAFLSAWRLMRPIGHNADVLFSL
jgi:hypothetical protein